MQIQENARDNLLWIEITDRKGFLVFGDLSRYQKEQGINVSSSEVDVICENCPHKLTFKKKEIEGEDRGDERKRKVWDWWKWRVFLRGNQISKSSLGGYYAQLKIEFYCVCCQTFLPPRN
jgi:hypothetical protein